MLLWLDGSTISILHYQAASGATVPIDVFVNREINFQTKFIGWADVFQMPHQHKYVAVVRKLTNDQTAMKVLTITLLLTIAFSLLAQDKIAGHYRNYFGIRIQLDTDSTFKYTWHFDLSASWTKGKWSLKNDTVYFQMIATYDTINYKNNDGTSSDKIILSVDETSERMTSEQYASMGLSSGGQNIHPYPDKLFFKRQKLFEIKNGKLIKKKVKGFWTKKKWRPWFFKSDD